MYPSYLINIIGIVLIKIWFHAVFATEIMKTEGIWVKYNKNVWTSFLFPFVFQHSL